MYLEIINQLRSIQKTLKSSSEDKYLTLKDVVRVSKYSSSTVHRSIKRGELKVCGRPGKLLFRRDDVDRWLNG